MKLHVFAFTTFLSMGVLSGCSNMYDSTDSYQSDQALSTSSPTKVRHARQHFTRGEQVGLEVPFTSSELTGNNNKDSKSSSNTNKAADTITGNKPGTVDTDNTSSDNSNSANGANKTKTRNNPASNSNTASNAS